MSDQDNTAVGLDWSAEEFADFWESHFEEQTLGINWMAKQMESEEGTRRLEESATILGDRHGWSSEPVRGFRAAMRKASEKANIDPPQSIHKTGSEKTGYRFKVGAARAQKNPRKKAGGVDWAASRMSQWIDEGRVTYSDLVDAVQKVVKP